MKYIKMLGLLAVAAAALMAFAGTASATTLTSPEGTTYTGGIEATAGKTELHGAFVTVVCNHSLAKGSVETHGAGTNAGGAVSSLSFTECNYATTVKVPGDLHINSANEVISNKAEVSIATSVGTCVFTTNNTVVGTLNEGKNASMSINSAGIPRTGGNFLCGSKGIWTGSYDLLTPNDLWVD